MGKIKYFTGILITIVIVLLSITQVISQSNGNMKDRFYIGPMNFFFDERLRTSAHLNWYDSLSYNMMHNYCAHLDSFPSEWTTQTQRDGGFFEDIGNYEDYIRGVITNWNDLAGDNSLILEREKILRPAYGQRFTYQAEMVNETILYWRTVFPSYGYDSSKTGEDYSEIWMGESVKGRNCIVGRDAPDFIVKDLYENCGQINDTAVVPDNTNSSGHGRLHSDIKLPRYNNRWYIKPRMRIDSMYAKTHPEDTVVIVYIKRFDGNFIDSSIIQCRNFLFYLSPQNPIYDGRYLERFYNYQDSVNHLSVRADSLAKGFDTLINSQVDYQIKWLGKVDVWLDYVRVDDSWAHFLFTDTWENEGNPNNPNSWKFHRKIKEEVEAFMDEEGLGYFWVDEVQFPNLECIGEVNRLVKEYSYNKMSLLFITDPIAFMGWSGMRHQDITEQPYWDTCINTAYRVGALTDIMVTQWFPVYYNVKYPSNLDVTKSDSFPVPKTYFEKATDYSDYTYNIEQGLQNRISWIIRQHKYYIEKAKSLGLIYAVINQINSDENSIKGTGGPDEWGIREPTNEEISMILNTSVAYGSKILLEFTYTTSRQDAMSGGYRYNMGLTSSQTDGYVNKRYFNYYGQEKWNFVVELNRKLQAVGNYMYPTGDTNKHLTHEKTVTVNQLTYPCSGCRLPYSYITDIRSLAPLINGINPCNEGEGWTEYYDCPDERFWELGFFNPKLTGLNMSDKSKYLYAVNKRTFPNKNNDGDIRVLEIKFNCNYLPDFNNWTIKDAVSDSVLTTFNKNYSGYITIAEFLPGEGKLFKLAPVMQEGGTLVCDESISSCSFICDSTVYNNGFDITINKDVTISFSSKGEIVMEGGEFKCGLDPQMSQNRVEFKGNNENWKGLSLTSCSQIIILESDFKNIAFNGNDSTSRNAAVTIINSYDFNINHCNFEMSTSSGGVNILITSFNDVEWGNSIVQYSAFTAKNGNNQNAISVTSLAL